MGVEGGWKVPGPGRVARRPGGRGLGGGRGAGYAGKGFPATALLTPASALARPLLGAGIWTTAPPTGGSSKGPSSSLLGSVPGSTEGPYTAGKLTPGWYSGRLSSSVVLPQTPVRPSLDLDILSVNPGGGLDQCAGHFQLRVWMTLVSWLQ